LIEGEVIFSCKKPGRWNDPRLNERFEEDKLRVVLSKAVFDMKKPDIVRT